MELLAQCNAVAHFEHAAEQYWVPVAASRRPGEVAAGELVAWLLDAGEDVGVGA